MERSEFYMKGTLEERFWIKVDKRGPDECWPWLAGRSKGGYGMMRTSGGARNYGHRIAYELVVGPIPAGLHLDHLCHNRDTSCLGGVTCLHRRCVNPAHLEPVPFLVNIARGHGPQSWTTCEAGHPFTEENTYRPARGGRMCRACARRRDRSRQPERVYNPEMRHAAYLRLLDRRKAAG